jgi:uncharacterized protein (TIGR04552 family)
VVNRPLILMPEDWSLGDLERMRLILRGGSVIDWKRLHFASHAEVDRYLRLCLFDADDPADLAHLAHLIAESVDYLRKSFRYKVAPQVAHPAQPHDLFLLASGVGDPKLRRMACLVLKLMHVVHHVEARGLLHRARISEEELMHLVAARVDAAIGELRREGLPIAAAAGSVKTRHSVITKLLAKKETLAAQIYDRVRYRVVTPTRDQVLPTLLRLCELLIPFNFVVPGQTQNSLLSFKKLVHEHAHLHALAPQLQFGLSLEEHEAVPPAGNEFSGESFRVLNFVADLPVRLPASAVEDGDGRIVFCMVEMQIVDRETAAANEHGANAHRRYKKRQLLKVLRRLSRGLVLPRDTRPVQR